MTNKTRRHIWPLAVMSLVAFGAFAVVVALSMGGPQTVSAHDCDAIDDAIAQAQCITLHQQQGEDHDQNGNGAGMNGDGMNGDANGDGMNGDGMMDDMMLMPSADNASYPYEFWLEGLDNGARLDWEKPMTVAAGSSVIGYRIERDAWNDSMSHPINMYGDATIDQIGSATDHSDLGLAYETVYTYRVLAIVDRDVATWWNALDCPMMNDVVSPATGEPQAGSDDPNADPRSAYCRMYAGLSDDAKVVVRRAYAGLEGMYPGKYMMNGAYADNAYGRYQLGKWTYKRTIETADSGGRLMALLDPPSPVRMLMADPACADSITVSWNPPMDFGTVATMDENGVYVGPDYIGGRRAGKEEVGEDATSVTYHIQRMVDGGAWNMGMYVNTTLYMDDDVEYGSVYKYRVRAKNGANLYSDWMMVREDLTEPAQPLRPGSPVAKHETNEMGQPIIALNWDAPDDSETQLWRSVSDIGAGNMSKSLSYRIERKIDDGMWVVLARAKPHEYIPGETPQSAILHFHKQKLIDDSADAIRAAAEGQSVKYRVSALVHACNQSDWISVDEVSGSPDLSLGDASSLSAASTAAGMVQLTWTSGRNANVHWVAGIGVNADGSYDQSRTVWAQASSGNSHTVTGLAAGQYLFAVIAGESTNGPWSNWTMSNQVTVN